MSNIRWRLYGLLLIVVTLTFIDRFNMNVAAKHIQQEFALSDIEIGSLLSAFVLGYAVFQVPGGWIGDRLGPRLVLTGAILWWSLFTAFTALGYSVASFWIIRFLIGVGESPALPCTNKMIGRWMAVSERARGSSLFLVAVGTGGAFTPPLIAWCMTTWGWRVSFLACGALGLAVAALWHWQSTEHPNQHPGVNAEELTHIQAFRTPVANPGPFPWRRLFASTSIPALIVANFLLGYVTYIFYTWFFLYLVNIRKLPVMAGSYWSTVPFLAILIGAPIGGYLSDRMVRQLGQPWGRRVPVVIAAFASCALFFTGSRLENPYHAIGLLAFAAGCNSIAAVSSWTLPNDLSDRYAATLAGVLNTSTNLGGALSPLLTPYIANRYSWVAALDVAAAFMIFVGLLWMLVHPERRID
ncbi:MAG: MFS transporter [Acidobacteria bacterium]|nr:MFS transporter [Acidobacteriota bacterium]